MGDDREARCPRCGGLLAPGAEWCGQCFQRLGSEPSPPPPEAPDPAARPPDPSTRPAARRAARGAGPFRVQEGEVRWECPTCGSPNPIEAMACGRCGAPFGELMGRGERSSAQTVPRSRAVRLSLILPGLGHAAAGHRAEGVARGILFAWVVGTLLALLLVRSGEGTGPYLALMVLYLGAAVGLYGVTAADAGRAVDGSPPIVTSRVLLYGVSGLMLLTVVVLFVVGVRVTT
jgi:hypothetical protein